MIFTFANMSKVAPWEAANALISDSLPENKNLQDHISRKSNDTIYLKNYLYELLVDFPGSLAPNWLYGN